ncbi:hypothetical protein [Thermococcus prieurii]
MSKKLLAVLLLVVLIAAPLGYIVYGYEEYKSVINPSKPTTIHTYVVIKYPNGTYVSLPLPAYNELVSQGYRPPVGTEKYVINVTGYLTGSPEVDVNMTMLAPYDRFTIVIGSPSVKLCSSNPSEFIGSCPLRTAAVSEISALVSSLFKRYYYQKARAMGMDNASAKQYAYEQTMNRYDIRYLSFMTKVSIGLGRIGNEKHLAVVLLGPAEGATKNEILIPRKGLLILEGKTDGALRAEVALIEYIINFQWPTGNQTKKATVAATG